MFRMFVYGLLGFGVYTLYKQRQSANPSVPFNPSAPTSQRVGGQPSQRYPWQGPTPVRVDNANQPWYAGSRQAMQGPSDSVTAVSLLQQGGSVVHSLSDVWGTMSDWFGSDTNDPESNLQSADSIDGVTSTMAGEAVESDNIVGDELATEFDDSDYSGSWDSGSVA